MRTSRPVAQGLADIGSHIATWRKLLRLTAQQVCERADISRDALRRLERGEPGVSMLTYLSVARALGVLDPVVQASDPYETDLGRARANLTLPQRVRH